MSLLGKKHLPAELEDYLHEHIPLTGAMGIRVLSVDETGVTLQAPLEPNLNHRGTAFGGSVSTLGITAAWACLYSALRTSGKTTRIVIQKSETSYLHPISSVFTVFCPAPSAVVMKRFLDTLERKGKARVSLKAVISCGPVEAAVFSGVYVAILL